MSNKIEVSFRGQILQRVYQFSPEQVWGLSDFGHQVWNKDIPLRYSCWDADIFDIKIRRTEMGHPGQQILCLYLLLKYWQYYFYIKKLITLAISLQRRKDRLLAKLLFSLIDYTAETAWETHYSTSPLFSCPSPVQEITKVSPSLCVVNSTWNQKHINIISPIKILLVYNNFKIFPIMKLFIYWMLKRFFKELVCLQKVTKSKLVDFRPWIISEVINNYLESIITQYLCNSKNPLSRVIISQRGNRTARILCNLFVYFITRFVKGRLHSVHRECKLHGVNRESFYKV